MKKTAIAIGAIALILILLQGCGKETKQTKKHIIINTDNTQEYIDIKRILRKINYVKLKSNHDKNFLIGDIRNIIIDKNIYVQNYNKILVFDLKGNPKFAIDSKGRSEGTYYEINDFHIDSLGTIEIWDRVKKQFLYFDSTGHYLHKTKINVEANYYTRLDSVYYFYNTGYYLKPGKDAYKISSFTMNGEKLKDYLPSNYLRMYPFNTPYIIGKYKNTIYFEDAPLNRLYNIRDNQISDSYHIQINNKSLTKDAYLEMRQMTAPERFSKITNHTYHSRGETAIGNFGIKLTIIANGKGHYCFYNLKTHNYLMGESIHETNLFNLPLRGHFIYKDKYIGYIHAYKILNSLNIKYLEKANPESYQLINNIKKEDNPILVFGDIESFP